MRWNALARSNGGSAFVYARQEDDALLARRALEEAAGQTGAFHVVSAQEMLARGADPQAWFGIDAAPGWVFEDGAEGARLGPASQRAAGGYAPGEPRMATGLVAWGPGCARRCGCRSCGRSTSRRRSPRCSRSRSRAPRAARSPACSSRDTSGLTEESGWASRRAGA